MGKNWERGNIVTSDRFNGKNNCGCFIPIMANYI